MIRTPVVSSNLSSVGYDATTSVLEVEFHGGRIYRYFSVPGHLYSGLMRASSHGTYLDRHIKKGGFHYVQVA